MQYRTNQKNGDKLSALGFGCMRLPKKGAGIDEERAIRQIRYAIDHGVNYLDTALMYGGSEQLLGKALADGYRQKVRIATKIHPTMVRSPEDFGRALSLQLKSLNTDHIDYYLMHGLMCVETWERLKALGATEFLDKAKKDGRIVNAAFSCHCPIDDFKTIVDDYDWAACQIQYNFLDVTNQAGTAGLKYAASKGLGVIIMEPLRGGTLARNIPAQIQAVWDGAEVKRTPAEWALRWVLNHPEVTIVLSGMNDEAHIEENLCVASKALPESMTSEELDVVNRAVEVYRGMMKIGCTGCRYCMPCPAGVDIPGCFAAYNTPSPVMPPRMAYMMTIGGKTEGTKSALASQCKDCGKCEQLCPQHLPIRRDLRMISKEYETIDARLAGSLMKYLMGFMRWNTMRKA
ncbi:MAG TPA: aldo/keto reductase [Methanocella sp.]|nr:aldo/keto reductase [Methanocella sp.]